MSEMGADVRMLRVKDVSLMTGFGISTIWLWVKEGKFPKPLKYSARITVWRSDVIQAFIESVSCQSKAA